MQKHLVTHHQPFLVAAMALLFMNGCAQQGYPTGGPKDTKPPVMQSATPPSGTAHFDRRQFLISFDEYVQVKDATSNVLISPPMKHNPEYASKGKGLLVTLTDTLLENTTYLFQFRGAVVDFNEGNALPACNYVFSTGSCVDSMTICGKVLEAFTAQPFKEEVTLLVYPDSSWTDSAVLLGHPLYVTRCEKSGFFQFLHMRPGRYRVVALEDGDRDLRLGVEDAVAFLDSAVTARPMVSADTAHPTPRPDTLAMLLSVPQHEKQRIAKSEMPTKGRAQITTHLPMRHPVVTDCSEPFVSVLNRKRDTLDIWTLRQGCDTLHLVVADSGQLNDTISIRYMERKQKGPVTPKPKSSFPKSLPSGKRDYFDTLWIRFENPARLTDSAQVDTLVLVTNQADNSRSRCGIVWDSSRRAARISFAGRPGGKYSFHIDARQFTDIWNQQHDPLDFSVEYSAVEDYGSIALTTQCADFSAPLIVQLIDEKSNTVAQELLTQNRQLVFQHLKPGKYSFRAIFDSNGDGQWTSGDYWHHQQPERVIYFTKTLELRKNWDMEERWEF